MIYNKKLSLNSLQVKYQMAIVTGGEIVPSSQNRNELRHIIIRPFRGGNQRIKKSFQSLIVRGENYFIGLFNNINNLLVTERFLQLLILGIWSSLGSGFTFQTIVQQNKSIILSSRILIHLDLNTHDTHL